MLQNPALVHDILTDVMTRGAAVVEKRKLLYALGAKQDRQSVWKRLLDSWEELDNPRSTLRGLEIWGVTMVLTMDADSTKSISFELVTNWE